MGGQLILNEEQIDLSPGTVIAITFQVSDIANVENRKGTGSNSFHVPKTRQNIAKLGHSDKTTSVSNLPYTKIPARYSQKGIQIVKNGYAEITEASDNFEITLYDGNTSFFALIDKKKLSDLDFSSLDHVWNRTNIVAYINNTSDIIYPIVDYGNAPFANPFVRITEVNFMMPWIFLHTVIEKIFEGTGYTLTGDFLTSTLYNNLLINLPTLIADPTKYVGLVNVTVPEVYSTEDLAQVIPLLFNNEVSDPQQADNPPGIFQQVSGPFGPMTTYNIDSDGTYSFRAVVHFTIFDTVSTVIQIAIHQAGIFDYLDQSINFFNGSGVAVLVADGIDLVVGDFIVVRIVAGQSGPNSGTFTIENDSLFECTAAQTTVIFGRWMPIARNLPDISQKDLLKAFMQMYCIIPITNTMTKEVRFVQFKEILNNKVYALDWTSKVDMSEQSKLTYKAASYAQENFLRYSEESSQAPEIGDGSFNVPDTTLDFQKDLLTLPFAATEMRKRFNGIDTPFVQRLDVTTLEWEDGSPRILILEKTDLGPDGYFDYQETGAGGGQNLDPENLAYFSLPGKTDNLAFDDNLISKHYTDFIAMLNSYKRITVAMKLTAVDIDNLDFSIPIYLQQFSAYFFINQVSQWIDHQTGCLVELVKID